MVKTMNSLVNKIILILILITPYISFASAPTTFATFSNISIEWDPDAGDGDACGCQYKLASSGSWLDCLNLFWDSVTGTYRGSVVGLTAGAIYDVKVNNGTDNEEVDDITMWSNTFPEGSVTNVTNTSDDLVISTSGTAEAYLVYQGSGGSATIDVNNGENTCVTISDDVHHVIIRNLILKDATLYGILIGDGVHDIIIDNNEITNWGNSAANDQGGIHSTDASDLYNIVIQRNTIHTPRMDSPAWPTHPNGPGGIFLEDVLYGLVIRYNDIHGAVGHYFNDGIGGCCNCEVGKGFMTLDSDIYGNNISHVFDDGIEAEGMNNNTRVYGNYIDNVFIYIGAAGNQKGPLYIFRNVFDVQRGSLSSDDIDDYIGPPYWNPSSDGAAIKLAYDSANCDKGATYIFHNTQLAYVPGEATLYTGAPAGGPVSTGGGDLYNVTSLNNIWHIRKSSWTVMSAGADPCSVINDYDLWWQGGGTTANCSTNGGYGSGDWEDHGYGEAAVYAAGEGNTTGDGGYYRLGSGETGHDDAVVLKNFNDANSRSDWQYEGIGPDIGVQERDSQQMKFGVAAYDYYENEAPSAPASFSGVSFQ